MKRWMKQAILLAIAAIGAACFSGCGAKSVAVPQNLTGKVYTQVTMWEEKGKISSVNYSIGRKIPVNTEVKILSMSSKEIVFEEAAFPGVKISLINIEKYSQMGTAELAAQYFGAEKVDLSKFTKEEQAFIKNFNGVYKAGITKEALIVARGYPSRHATPTLQYDTWKYWRNKWVTKNVGFENNKVTTFNGAPLK
jgi:hypothetical protein